MSKPTGQLLVKQSALQLAGLLLTVICVWWVDPITAKSVLLGGLIFWAPNAYFTFYAFRLRGAQAALQVLQNMYRGEVGKFLLTAAGFASAFVLVKPLNIVALFTAFFAMMLVHWYQTSRW